MRHTVRAIGIAVAVGTSWLALLGTVAAQTPPPPPLRSPYLTSLTNLEVENYLEGNESLIFVPVGTVQAHGILPVDAEYVAAEALALKMAQATGGLVFPHLQFTYPGAGVIGRGTIQVSPSEGLAYLKSIARSLLRQGFKRQVYVTSHNAAAPQTISPLVLELFYETRHPVLYLQGDILLSQAGADFEKVLLGAYSVVGRLEDIPANLTPKVAELGTNEALRTLRSLNSSVGARDGTVGFFLPEDKEGLTGRAVTPEQRAALAKEGVAMIEAAVKASNIQTVVEALRDHQRFTREYLIPKFGDLLPK